MSALELDTCLRRSLGSVRLDGRMRTGMLAFGVLTLVACANSDRAGTAGGARYVPQARNVTVTTVPPATGPLDGLSADTDGPTR